MTQRNHADSDCSFGMIGKVRPRSAYLPAARQQVPTDFSNADKLHRTAFHKAEGSDPRKA